MPELRYDYDHHPFPAADWLGDDAASRHRRSLSSGRDWVLPLLAALILGAVAWRSFRPSWVVLTGYFVCRVVDEVAGSSRYLVSRIGLGVAASILLASPWLDGEWLPIAPAVFVLAVLASRQVGRTLHPTAVVWLAVPLFFGAGLLSLTLSERFVGDAILAGLTGAGLIGMTFVLTLTRVAKNQQRLRLAEARGGHLDLIDGRVRIPTPSGTFALGCPARSLSRPGASWAGCSGPLATSSPGTIVVRLGDCGACASVDPAGAKKIAVEAEGRQLVVAYEHYTPLVAALEQGSLTPHLRALAKLRHPLVWIAGGLLAVESARSGPDDDSTEAALLDFALAVEAHVREGDSAYR